MQTKTIDIDESGRILVDNRLFYPSSDGNQNIVENADTNEKALLIRCDDPEKARRVAAFADKVLSAAGGKNCFKSIIYPTILKREGMEEPEYYSFTGIPAGIAGKDLYPLSKSLYRQGFSIYSRIMAAINLSEIFDVLHDFMGNIFLSLHPEDIFVDTANGDIYLWIEKWLERITSPDEVEDFGFSPEWYSKEDRVFDEYDLRFFMAYAIFRLLCNEEPFDGSETLVQFPLLTKAAVSSMHRDKYSFCLAKGNNYISEYIGQELQKKWNALPGFIRDEFEKNFIAGIDRKENRTDAAEWLFIMRKMRDCLVYVNGQFRFCNPDESNQVLFITADQYKIPVWPRKAIYWYHVGMPRNETGNGIVAGITVNNGKYFLNNLSGDVWSVTAGNSTVFIYPDRNMEVIEGMEIQLGNHKILKVVQEIGL